jgi:pyruvate formate lyase activating enzyme
METLEVFKILKTTEGIITTTLVFSVGCNMSCKYCEMPELKHKELRNDVELTPQQLIDFIIKQDESSLNPTNVIMFAAGEPLLHPNFLKETAIIAHKMGLKVAVETSFYVEKEAIDIVFPYIDEYCISIKLMDDQKHKEYTGVSNFKILENIIYFGKNLALNKNNTINAVITIPIIPGVNDTRKNTEETLCFAYRYGFKKVIALPFISYEDKYRNLGLDYPPSRNDDYLFYKKFSSIQTLTNMYSMGYTFL